jgi:hypothetical protein
MNLFEIEKEFRDSELYKKYNAQFVISFTPLGIVLRIYVRSKNFDWNTQLKNDLPSENIGAALYRFFAETLYRLKKHF